MNARESERLRREIVQLFKQITRPNTTKIVRLGKKMCAYFEFETIGDIICGKTLEAAVVHIDPILADKSTSWHRVAMRLAFLCPLTLARRLDTSRVVFGKVQDAVSTSLSDSECRRWLERLADDPTITRDEIKASYPNREERGVRLPRNMDQGCEKAREYTLRLRGYQFGLRARMSECRARREFTPETSASVSAVKLASLELREELDLFLRECDNIECMLAAQPVTRVQQRDDCGESRRGYS